METCNSLNSDHDLLPSLLTIGKQIKRGVLPSQEELPLLIKQTRLLTLHYSVKRQAIIDLHMSGIQSTLYEIDATQSLIDNMHSILVNLSEKISNKFQPQF